MKDNPYDLAVFGGVAYMLNGFIMTKAQWYRAAKRRERDWDEIALKLIGGMRSEGKTIPDDLREIELSAWSRQRTAA